MIKCPKVSLMEDKNTNYFDLPRLLRVHDLDIRKVARNNLLLRTGEYFHLLSKFLDFMPKAVFSLDKIAAQKGDEFDYYNLTDLRKMLDDIGCHKFSHAMEDIVKAGKRGHHGFAADCAKRIPDELNKIHEEIMAAQKSEAPEITAIDIGDNEPVYTNLTVSYRAYSLKKVLKLLDHEEATRKLRILAIDDAPVILKTISSVLSDEYKVYGMTHPTTLEKFLQQITPELFLLDYKMPERSGFDLVPIIRSFEEHKNTPIIFLTSLGTIDHISAALALGACDFIVKPFQGNILREKIAKHIVRKKLF